MRRARHVWDRKGSVSIELALVLIFFFVPLTVGSIDMLFVLTQRYQMYQALQSLYFYAWANPSNASNVQAISAILAQASRNSVAPIVQAGAPVTYYGCSHVQQRPGAPPPSAGAKPGCALKGQGVDQTYVTYGLTSTVILPVPIPGFGGQYTLNLSGMVQTQ